MNSNKIISFILLVSFCCLKTSGQDSVPKINPCFMGEMMKRNHLKIEKNTEMDKTDLYPEDSQIYTIPVVFHIIYVNKGQGPDALSDKVFQSQITALNEGYGRYGQGINSSQISTDSKIRFCLAKKDPDGNTSSGINRIQNSYYSRLPDKDGTDDENLKLLIGWDRKRYLNVWVVSQIDGSDNIAGYAYLPRNSVPIKNSKPEPINKDGVVLNYRFVGSINPFSPLAYREGETLTHEIGHYLDLMHPWGGDNKDIGEGGCGDDDGVDDTPDCDQIFYSKYPECSHPSQCGNRRQIENYMDYSDERCSNLFTTGQAKKMRRAIRKYRPELVSCENLKRVGACNGASCQHKKTEYVDAVSLSPNPSSGIINAYFWLEDLRNINFYFINNLGQIVYSLENIKAVSGTYPLDITMLKDGVYTAVITGGKKEITQKIIIIH